MPIDSYFIFNGTRSDDMGLLMASDPVSVHPARRGELFPIPGRNGSIVREDGSYDTYTVTYDALLDSKDKASDVYAHAREVAAWLLGSRGFCRLEDSYEPEYFRLARCAAQMSVENRLARFGRAQISFDVQPQRYLKSGEIPLTFQGGDVSTITNPTQFEARPLLRFTDTASTPPFVPVSITLNEDHIINGAGAVVDASADASVLGYAVSNPVSCAGKEYARVTGNGYSFLDSNGNSRRGGFSKTGGWSNDLTRENYQVAVPSWASTIVVSRGRNAYDPVALALKDFRPNAGAAAVTINGTTVNLDFSANGTIFLDCDLYDAYYEDGSNANNAVSFSSYVDAYPTFPGLVSGVNAIVPNDGSILDFELVPRWWTL